MMMVAGLLLQFGKSGLLLLGQSVVVVLVAILQGKS
jgi:hypothetical protein